MYLIMLSEMAVGDGDTSWSLNSINEPIRAIGHRNVVDPKVGRAEDGNPIPVASGPQTDVADRVSNQATRSGNNVVNVEAVDDDVLDELDGDTCPAGNVDVDAPSINGLVTSHDELLVEPDGHRAREDDPQGLRLGHRVAKGPRLGIDHIIVRGVRYCIECPHLSADGSVAEAFGTIC